MLGVERARARLRLELDRCRAPYGPARSVHVRIELSVVVMMRRVVDHAARMVQVRIGVHVRQVARRHGRSFLLTQAVTVCTV